MLNKLGGVRIYCLFCFLVIVVLEKTISAFRSWIVFKNPIAPLGKLSICDT